MAKILLVDDEPSVLVVLSELLKADEHDVTSIQSSTKAVKLIQSASDYDVAVFDVRMSPVDGMKLLKMAKEQKPNMEVIMLTAYFSKELDLEAALLGAFAYIGKPFKVHDILSTIESALAKKTAAGDAKG